MWLKAVLAHAARPRTVGRLRAATAALLLAGLLWAAPAAHAQTTASNAVVAAEDVFAPLYAGYLVYNNIPDALSAALRLSAEAYQHYDVLVDSNTVWSASLDIPADADITIRGAHGPIPDVPEAPQDVIIESLSPFLPVIQTVAAIYDTYDVYNNDLIIEGLTLTGGSVGFHAHSSSLPTLNRVYAIENLYSGVLVEDLSRVQLINCSISRNGGDGVQVGANGFAQILYCSIIENLQAGVYVYAADGTGFGGGAGAGDASVVNTLVFRNDGSGLEWSVPPLTPPLLDTNDVYLNNPDYVNVVPDANSLSADPGLWSDYITDEPSPWVGALAFSQCTYQIYHLYDIYNVYGGTSPVIDMAALGYEILPFTAEDFYRQPRPVGFYDANDPIPDIGADEVQLCSFDFTLPLWFECVVTPSPMGKIPALTAQIELGLTPPIDPATFSVFVVPQDGDPNILSNRIPFQLDSWTGGSTYYYTNTNAIDTVLVDDGSGTVTLGDLIVDGHARVYLLVGDYLFGENDNDPLISGNARTGRHFIMDTFPPRMVAPAPGISADDSFGTPNLGGPLAEIYNNALVYTTATAPSGMHPTAPGPTFFQGAVPFPVLTPPIGNPASSDGLITENQFIGIGTQMFIDVGSIANGWPVEPLQIGIRPAFIDTQPVTDAGELFPARILAGFHPSNTVTTVGPSNGIAEWILGGSALMAGVYAHCVYTTSGSNPDTDISFPLADLDNLAVTTRWRFDDDDDMTVITGLDWDLAPAHTSIRFRPLDRAGNKIELDEMLEPLQVWWMIDVNTRIAPNREGQTITRGTKFDWRLDRFIEPQIPALWTPLPLFTWRLYWGDNFDGPFVPAPGAWGAWDAWSTEKVWSDMLTSNEDFGGRWLLLVVLGTDEAGNVEPFPLELLGPSAAGFEYLEPQSPPQSANWQRFNIGVGTLDTSISPTFWHESRADIPDSPLLPDAAGETSFGTQTVVPSPGDVNNFYAKGAFRVTMTTQAPAVAKVGWVLLRGDGSEVYSYLTAPPGSVTVSPGSWTVYLPAVWDLVDRLEDTTLPRQPRYYVFRAWTYLDGNNNAIWDDAELADETPASVAFTVVPESSIENYRRNRESIDRQPVKIQEEQ